MRVRVSFALRILSHERLSAHRSAKHGAMPTLSTVYTIYCDGKKRFAALVGGHDRQGKHLHPPPSTIFRKVVAAA